MSCDSDWYDIRNASKCPEMTFMFMAVQCTLFSWQSVHRTLGHVISHRKESFLWSHIHDFFSPGSIRCQSNHFESRPLAKQKTNLVSRSFGRCSYLTLFIVPWNCGHDQLRYSTKYNCRRRQVVQQLIDLTSFRLLYFVSKRESFYSKLTHVLGFMTWESLVMLMINRLSSMILHKIWISRLLVTNQNT